MVQPPAAIGDPVDAIDTPALIVDLDALDDNIGRMAAFGREKAIAIRPHAKTHRCPAVALRQMAAGAVGQCAQTVGEAEALVEGGVRDVIVTNEILAPSKLSRLARLAERARIGLLVDSLDGVAAASRAAVEAGFGLDVLVEIEVGMGRCGVAPGSAAADLASRVADSAGLRFRGLQAYNGRAQHIAAYAGRREAVSRAGDAVRETLAALDRQGLKAEIVGGAGTGTFRLEAEAGLWTELQVGSYVFMDREYSALETEDGRVAPDFRQSLFVLAEVISRPAPGRAIVNGGLKALSTEQGRPGVHGRPDLDCVATSDEHCRLEGANAEGAPRLGDHVRLVPSHCDPTVNLHDWIVAVRGDRVEDVWPVSGRGRSR